MTAAPALAARLQAVTHRYGRTLALDDVSIELRPERWRSWTNTLLRAAAESGTGRSYGELWKPD